MNAVPSPAGDAVAYLPTRAELEELLAQKRMSLVHLAGAIANSRDRAWCEDVVQTVSVEVLQKIDAGAPFVETTLWQYVCWTLRNRVIDCKRRKEWRLLEDFAGERADQGPAAVAAQVPADDPTPLGAALHRERFERKKKLLSDILEEYARRCESQPRMLSGKEVFERMLRGESPEQTAAAMQMPRNTIDKARRDARLRLRELMDKHDVHHSVFATFYRREMKHPFQAERMNAGTLQVQSASELFRWIMDETGALCPQEDRLRNYAKDASRDDLRDIRYHVEEARCPLCRGMLEAWRPAP